MNDDRIEPTFKPLNLDDDEPTSLDTKQDTKQETKGDKKKDSFLDSSGPDNYGDPEDMSIKITADRARDRFSEEMSEPTTEDRPSIFDQMKVERNTESTEFSLFTGRIDRFHASIILVAGSLLGLFFIIYLEAILSTLISITGGTVVENGYQTDPAIYIGIGATVWLLSLLIIAMGRLRDIGKSPLFSIFLFVPPLSFIIIWAAMLPGSAETNRFGPPPGAYGLKTWLFAGMILGLLPLLVYMNLDSVAGYLEEIVRRFNPE